MYEAFNDVMIKLQYHAKGFLTVAGVLEAVSAGALEQNIGCHSQVPATTCAARKYGLLFLNEHHRH